jgi:DtxR family Mn-dependent transcriptional regulator
MVPTMADVPLTELPAGQPAVVSRVSDRDPAQLRQIDALGVRPGTQISVLSFADDDISIMLADQERSIPAGMAGLIHVTPVGSAPTS